MSSRLELPPVDVSLMEPQVTPAAQEFASRFTTKASATVVGIRQRTQNQTPVPQMLGGAATARLLEGLAMSIGARRILEIGTFTGATALALAEELPAEVEITTIEFDPETAAIARSNFDASAAGQRIDFRVGDARSLITELVGPFDLIFIDAWKQHYVDYYEGLMPKLAPRGLIVADDVIWGGLPFNPAAVDSESDGVRRFVRHVHEDPRTRSVVLTVEDGLMLIWKDARRS